jgi:23S rRNA (adenine2503-C2)-methyltransferase
MRGLRAKVNLIALNPGPEIPFRDAAGRACAGISERADSGRNSGVYSRPRGRDIYAACGQLKHTTELVQLQP